MEVPCTVAIYNYRLIYLCVIIVIYMQLRYRKSKSIIILTSNK